MADVSIDKEQLDDDEIDRLKQRVEGDDGD